MFDFVFTIITESFIPVLAWYFPLLMLFSFVGSLVRGGK